MESIGEKRRSVRRGIAAGAEVLALLGIGGLAAQASGPDWSEFGPSAYREAAGLADRLGLTAEQQEKVRRILSETFAKDREIREERRDHRRDHQMDPRGERGPFPGGPESRFPG